MSFEQQYATVAFKKILTNFETTSSIDLVVSNQIKSLRIFRIFKSKTGDNLSTIWFPK